MSIGIKQSGGSTVVGLEIESGGVVDKSSHCCQRLSADAASN